MRGGVHHAVALVVEAGGRFGERRREEEESQQKRGNTDEDFHRHLSELVNENYAEAARKPSQKTLRNALADNGASLDELRRFALGPWIISNAEVDAAGDRRMVVEKKDLDGIGVGVDKSGFAVVLEGLRAGLAGIGD